MDEHTAVNRKLWDELAPLHAASAHYDVGSFLAGANTLGRLEIDEVGPVEGKRLVHLMCHFGLDTLSWARLGAHVTGVDFSGEAVRIGRELAERTGLAAEFVESDVLAAPDRLASRYDVVFLSKGVLMWIRDLPALARVCARLLEPGGVLYLLDSHPLANAAAGSSYFAAPEPLVVVADGSYAVSDAGLSHQESREWPHSLGDVVTALAQAGLRLEFLHEFPGAEAERFPLPALDDPTLPAFFSVRAVRDPA
ncbi:class I SAM-dependent methyltransferase [Flindersiella endophytica]